MLKDILLQEREARLRRIEQAISEKLEELRNLNEQISRLKTETEENKQTYIEKQYLPKCLPTSQLLDDLRVMTCILNESHEPEVKAKVKEFMSDLLAEIKARESEGIDFKLSSVAPEIAKLFEEVGK